MTKNSLSSQASKQSYTAKKKDPSLKKCQPWNPHEFKYYSLFLQRSGAAGTGGTLYDNVGSTPESQPLNSRNINHTTDILLMGAAEKLYTMAPKKSKRNYQAEVLKRDSSYNNFVGKTIHEREAGRNLRSYSP